MNPFEMIKAQLSQVVPFQNHVGVTLLEVGDGLASAQLEQRGETENHIQSQHAGAMFTLGEAASGAAMAGALAPVILQVRPVAAKANVAFVKIAKGTLSAHATTSRSGAELLAELESIGKVSFMVQVDIRDAGAETVAQMDIEWHVSTRKK